MYCTDIPTLIVPKSGYGSDLWPGPFPMAVSHRMAFSSGELLSRATVGRKVGGGRATQGRYTDKGLVVQ